MIRSAIGITNSRLIQNFTHCLVPSGCFLLPEAVTESDPPQCLLHLKGGEQERRVVAIEFPELVVVDHTVSVVVNLIPVSEASTRVHVVERAGGVR